MALRFIGLSVAPFAPLFDLSDAELGRRDMRRMIADAKPGFPCRISLADAEPGERVLLVSHAHHPAHSPYKASGPIFVREAARESFDGIKVPEVLRNRLLSVRAYDANDLIVDAEIGDGNEIEALLANLFARPDAAYIHVHNARRGCYACRVERA
jgi:hypothetical protein